MVDQQRRRTRAAAPAVFVGDLGREAGLSLWTVEPDGRFIFHSDRLALPKDEPQTLADFLPYVVEADRDKVRLIAEQALAHGGSGQYTCTIQRSNGRQVKYKCTWRAEPVKGRGFRMRGVSQDVTALLEAKAAIDERYRLSELAESLSGVGHWRIDLLTGEIWWSGQVYRICGAPFGSPPAELLDICHPDDREALAEHRRVNRLRETAGCEFRIVRPDGEIRYVASRSGLERDSDGDVVARFGTLADLTEIKRAEAAARESEARYRFIAEHAPDMIARVTPGGQITYVSPSCERVFGYTPEEHMRISAREMAHPEDLPKVTAAIQQMVKERRTRLHEPLTYRAFRKDGSMIWIESNPSMIVDEDGEPLEFVDIVRDVTQQRAFEAELTAARHEAEAATAAKSAFLANMSHEIRTPLNGVVAMADALAGAGLGEREREMVEIIRASSRTLERLLSDVIDLARVESGQLSLELEPFHLGRAVRDVTALCELKAQEKEDELLVDIDPAAETWVTGDPVRFKQIVTNLVSNAVKFTDAGRVNVILRPSAKGWRLTVSDTGIGFSDDVKARLFGRFQQADDSISRRYGGSGLGLAISRQLAELMGGSLDCESEPGAGSSFWADLPLPAADAPEAAARTAPEEAAEQAAPERELRVLLADDHPTNRKVVEMILTGAGVHITAVENGVEAVAAFRAGVFDLVLMDMQMPLMDGLEATRQIRTLEAASGAARTPLIMLTANALREHVAESLQAGADGHIAKPIRPPALLQAVAEAVSAAGAPASEAPPASAAG